MSFKEFLEDLKHKSEQPAKKGSVWLSFGVAFGALATVAIFGWFLLINVKFTSNLQREQLKNQYMLAALCNLPENQSACAAGLSDFEHDKD